MVSRKKFSKYLLIFFILIFLACIFINDYRNVPRYTIQYIGKGARDVSPEIHEGVTAVQEVPYYIGDEGISFQFTTFGHRVIGDVSIRGIGKKNGFVYIDEVIPGKSFKNDAFVDILFPEGVPEKNDIISVTFSSTSTPGAGLALLTSGTDSIPELALTVNGVENDSDAMVRRLVSSKGYYFPIVIAGMGITFMVVAFLLLRKTPVTLEKIYFITALGLGILYMIIMIPLSIPDEQVHYQAAYNLSNVFCFQSKDRIYGDAQHFDYSNLGGHYNLRTGYDRFMREIFKPTESYERSERTLNYPGYVPMYLPQALGISIARLFHANFYFTFYAGRLFNLLFFITCTFFAIRIVPRFKPLFAILGMMPMALHQAASYSYDSFINGAAFLLIAMILKLTDSKEKLTIKELLPAMITGVLLCPTKAVYAPMMLLFFLVPWERFGSKRKHFFTVCGIILIAAVHVLYVQHGMLSAITNTDKVTTNYQGFTEYTTADIITNPMQALKIFAHTFRRNSFGWLQQSTGSILSGLTITIREYYIFIYMVILILSSFKYENELYRVSIGMRCLYLICSAGVIAAVMLTMFLAETPKDSVLIDGVQGRYFIPILPLLYMCLNNNMIVLRKPIEKWLISIAVITNILILNQVMFTTLMYN